MKKNLVDREESVKKNLIAQFTYAFKRCNVGLYMNLLNIKKDAWYANWKIESLKHTNHK